MRRVAVVVLLALVLAACGGDDGAAPSTTTDAPATTTSAPASTTTEPATTTTTCPVPPEGPPVDAFDVDGDGVDEVLRAAGQGAAVDIYELRRLDGCAEVTVTLDGLPAQFAVGGSVLLLQGIRCEGVRFVHLGATSEDGVTYVTLDLLYELRDGELVLVDDRSGQLSADDPELADYSSLVC